MVDPWSKFLESSRQLNDTIQQIPQNNMRMMLLGKQIQDENNQRDIFRNADPSNPEATVGALYKGGYGKEAMSFQQAMQAAQASKFKSAAEMYKLSQAAAEHIAAQPDDLILQAYETVATHLGKQTGQDPAQQIEWARRTAQQPGGLALIRQQAIQQAGQMKYQIANLGNRQQVVAVGPGGMQVVGEPLPIEVTPAEQARIDYYRAQAGKGGDDTGRTKPTFGYEYAPDGSITFVKGGPHDPNAPQNQPKKTEGGKVIPAGQLIDLADMKKVRDELQLADELIKKKKAEKKDIKTGPVSGRVQSAEAFVGAADDDFLTLRQRFSTAENIMLKLRSGAAVTDQEFERFKREYPNVNDPPETRDKKLENAIAYATGLLDEKINLLDEGGYKVPGSVRSGNKKPQNGNAASARGGIEIGHVEDGYVFKGGDPSNPENWEKE